MDRKITSFPIKNQKIIDKSHFHNDKRRTFAYMITELSILIPTYNHVCLPLVKTLQRQASSVEGLSYELLVADDGSTDKETVEVNRAINVYEHCRLIECPENRGRACIRNFLAQQSSGKWLLFLDSNMVVERSDYIAHYVRLLKEGDNAPILYGGYTIPDKDDQSLRYELERKNIQNRDYRLRQGKAYQNFHTSNFIVRREVALAHPFDERFRHYGYEDVLWGKTLEQHHIGITHVDNPLRFEDFQSNATFLRKSNEAMETLYLFRKELAGYSALLALTDKLNTLHLTPILAKLFMLSKDKMEQRLVKSGSPLWLFNLYRIGRMSELFSKNNKQ